MQFNANSGNCVLGKSKDYIVEQVCILGFMLVSLLFVEDEWRGILFLSPEDEALIRLLPAFKVCNSSDQ
jgi:hypothetical protein